MRVRFYRDPETDEPLSIAMGLRRMRSKKSLGGPGKDRPGLDGSRVAVGRTGNGRYLRVIYVPDPEPDSVFVITAYELTGKPLLA